MTNQSPCHHLLHLQILPSSLLSCLPWLRQLGQQLENKWINQLKFVRSFKINNANIIFIPAAAPAAGAAPTADPMFVIKSLTLALSRALANKPGQYGSTSTLAALRTVWIFSPWKIKITLYFNQIPINK